MNRNNVTGGVGFFGLLFIVLLVLKLTGFTTIGWFWVVLPLLIPPVCMIIFGIVLLILFKDIFRG